MGARGGGHESPQWCRLPPLGHREATHAPSKKEKKVKGREGKGREGKGREVSTVSHGVNGVKTCTCTMSYLSCDAITYSVFTKLIVKML